MFINHALIMMSEKNIAPLNEPASRISGLIITFNEAENIQKCIQSLKEVCDDVVVIDSNSADKTREIAKAEGATVIVQPFLGDGPQRILGLAYCKHEWCLIWMLTRGSRMTVLERFKRCN